MGAAIAWGQVLENPALYGATSAEECVKRVIRGTTLFWRDKDEEASRSGGNYIGIPHPDNFPLGKQGHPQPYWLVALQSEAEPAIEIPTPFPEQFEAFFKQWFDGCSECMAQGINATPGTEADARSEWRVYFSGDSASESDADRVVTTVAQYFQVKLAPKGGAIRKASTYVREKKWQAVANYSVMGKPTSIWSEWHELALQLKLSLVS